MDRQQDDRQIEGGELADIVATAVNRAAERGYRVSTAVTMDTTHYLSRLIRLSQEIARSLGHDTVTRADVDLAKAIIGVETRSSQDGSPDEYEHNNQENLAPGQE
jgi:DNA replicative helicase MCM subunit Mcm2 (Cdc46/Mcm family)